MSKRVQVASTCVCGHEVRFDVRKPTAHTPSVAKASCMCGSRYMVACRLNGRARQVHVTPTLLELSEIASGVAKRAIAERSGG